MAKLTISLSPTHGSPGKLTIHEVWGSEDNIYEGDHGMIVARGLPAPGEYFSKEKFDEYIAVIPVICPVWKDRLPYKSVTVICKAALVGEVSYWLEYVHGGGCIDEVLELAEGKVALRSNYMC